MALSVFYKIVTASVKKNRIFNKSPLSRKCRYIPENKKKLFYYQFFQILKKILP